MTQVPVTHKINLNFLHLQSSSMLLCLCKLCVLLFALLATFRTILFLKFRTKTPSISPQVTEYDYSDDDDDETCSLSSTSSESEDDGEEIEEENRTGEYFRFRGCGSSYDGGIVSVYGDDERLSAPAAVMDSTGENASGNLGLRSWDTGVRRRMTAVIAEWAPGIGNSAGVISGGVRKVYVREDGRYEFGDMRNVTSSPLEYVTESQLDLWWPNPYMLNI